MNKGVFIAFEGLDGSGKTTQLKVLKDKLLERKIKCRDEREPSDGVLGLIARDAIKKKISLSPQAMALLFAADRYEHVLNDIKPCIDKGVHVLTDRFLFSNFAYQGLTSSYEDLYLYNKNTIELLMPDLTIFIDTEPGVSLNRIELNRTEKELFDNEGAAVRANFLGIIDKMRDKTKTMIFDGNRPQEAIADEIWRAVAPMFMN